MTLLHDTVIRYPQGMVQIPFCALVHTFNKHVADVSLRICVALLLGMSTSLLKERVYGKFCIETLHERHNGIQRLVVCLSEYLQERSRTLVSNITYFA